MNVKSDRGTRQHHNTTKSITITCVPNRKSRDRVGAGGESPHHRPSRESTSRVRKRGEWRSKEVWFVRGNSIAINWRRLDCYGASKAGKREALLILMHET